MFLGLPVCKILSIASSLGLAVVLLETESIHLFETLKTYANMKWLECGIFRLVLDYAFVPMNISFLLLCLYMFVLRTATM
jgi:hypothetical protein